MGQAYTMWAASSIVIDPSGDIVVDWGAASAGNSTIAKLDANGSELWKTDVPTLQTFSSDGADGIVVVSFTTNPWVLSVVRRDANGQALWDRQYTSADGTAVTSDAQGNIYVAGTFIGAVDFGVETLVADGVTGFVLKLDATGQAQWVRSYPGQIGTGDERMAWTDAIVDALGNPMLSLDFNGGYDFGAGTFTGASDAIVKLRADSGETLWAQELGVGGQNDAASSIASDGQFSHYVAGTFGPGAITIGDQTLYANDSGVGAVDALVFQISE